MWQRALLSLLFVLMLTGCAVSPEPIARVPAFEGDAIPVVAEVDVLAATEAMRAAVLEEIAGGSARSRFEALNRFIIDPDGLGFHYDLWRTSTAEQAFVDRRGNCVAFSNLYIALAREIGLEAYYQEARTMPDWEERGDAIVMGFHVNVAVRIDGVTYTVDVDDQVAERVTNLRIVSDDRGAAHFYNNHAAEGLLEDELPVAYAYASHALTLAPDTSFIWSNLGLVLARNGQPDDAILAFEQAIALDSSNLSAMNNLAGLLRDRGELARADELDAHVLARRRSDPFYWWLLGKRSLAAGNTEQAVAHFERAVERRPEDARLRRALTEARVANGELVPQDLVNEQAFAIPDGEQ